jgi:transcriptional regulator with XRE-family HTH domain
MDTIGSRIKAFRLASGLTQEDVFRDTGGDNGGIKQSALSAIESTKKPTKPGSEIIASLIAAYSTLSPDWLLLGTEPMLRDGRTHTATVVSENKLTRANPAADFTSAQGTIDAVVNGLLQQQLEEKDRRIADKDTIIENKETIIDMQKEEIERLRSVGKFDDSSDAADESDEFTEAPLDPKGPLGRGVQLMLRPKRVRGLWRAADDVAELS